MLNREQFNLLDILEQITYINKHLHNTSLTKLCDSIGISRTTISKRFRSKGYILKDNQYVLMSATKELPNKTVEERLNLLEQKVKKLENRHTTATSNLKYYTGTEVVRSYRVNEDIQKQFKTFCKRHSEYKVSDILSQALEEFLNNHN